MSKSKSSAQTVRAPSPSGCNFPVMTHLTKDERLKLESIAKSESRSMAAVARIFILKGFERHASSPE